VLKDRYYDVFIGKSYISFIYGILRLKKYQKDALIIDDSKVVLGNQCFVNIGYLEKMLFKKIGEDYKIFPLSNIKKYISPVNTIIFLNEKMLEFGISPFGNIKEVARKLPQCFSKNILKELNEIGPEGFDKICFEFFDSVIEKTLNSYAAKKIKFDFKPSEQTVDKLYAEFLSYLNDKQMDSKQLHFVLQVLFQTVFSNAKSNTESSYLLTSILSPRYKINDKLLADDLAFIFKDLGGVYQDANVDEWEIFKNQLEYIKLNSLDGIVGFDNLFYYGKLSSSVPFVCSETDFQYNSVHLKCPIEHKFMDFYKNKRLLFSKLDRLGTDIPHWEVFIDSDGVFQAIYSYADNLGTKPEFFHKTVADDVFKSLSEVLPGLDKADWSGQMEFSRGSDSWIEYHIKDKEILIPKKVAENSHLYNRDNGVKVTKLDYCGPSRSKSMGLFSYTLDLMSSL